MNKRAGRILWGILAVGGLIGGSAIGATLWTIQQSVQEHIRMARTAHPGAGDDVAALVEFMNSEDHALRERNRAVWTLGRLRASEARAALEAAHTGTICDHDHALCQRELDKALARCR